MGTQEKFEHQRNKG